MLETKHLNCIEETMERKNSDLFYNPGNLVRVKKQRINFALKTRTYKEAQKLSLKKLDLSKIRKEKNDKEKEYLEELKKIGSKNVNYLRMINVFADKFKKLTGSNFQFQKKRVLYFNENDSQKHKIIPSDGKRLIKSFDKILSVTSDSGVIDIMIEDMIDLWSDWNKATNSNLVGFFEKQCENEIGSFYMKAKKKKGTGSKSSLFSSKANSDNIDKHRSYFSEAV